jgi:hypothetical protein
MCHAAGMTKALNGFSLLVADPREVRPATSRGDQFLEDSTSIMIQP